MQPSRVQYFYADHWPIRLWHGAAIALSIIGWWHVGGWAALLDRTTWFLAIPALVLFVALGHFTGLLVGWPILGALYYGRMLENGGPFKPGDPVRILSRPHRGRISRVYAAWQGDYVRVELGDGAKERFEDIFHPAELLRVQADVPLAQGVKFDV